MDDPLRLIDHFAQLKDPRRGPALRHQLIDIVMIAITAVICGAASWRDIEAFGLTKRSWFQTFLSLPSGIPSHDTFARVFARIDPQKFQECFLVWIRAVSHLTRGQLIAIDGKTLRHSFDTAARKSALHLVSAWCSENQLVLGQVAVEQKSNEITAIPKLLDLLDVRGSTITIDAAGCQKAIAAKIHDNGGRYVLGLKGNQPGLHDHVELAFSGATAEALTTRLGSAFQSIGKEHGRLEVRRYWTTTDLSILDGREREWAGLTAIGIADRQNEQSGKTTIERRYFALSFAATPEALATAVRGHWGIENELHWSMDVTFREDESRIRKDHAPENFALLRRIALTLLKQASCTFPGQGRRGVKDKKFSIRTKRLMAGWDEGFLLHVLFSAPGASAQGAPPPQPG